jgi:hypothetical protein
MIMNQRVVRTLAHCFSVKTNHLRVVVFHAQRIFGALHRQRRRRRRDLGELLVVFALYIRRKNFHWHMSRGLFSDYHMSGVLKAGDQPKCQQPSK